MLKIRDFLAFLKGLHTSKNAENQRFSGIFCYFWAIFHENPWIFMIFLLKMPDLWVFCGNFCEI